jgi:5S rRNA maturation endonuclease (ribonuclease M5)
VALVEAALKGLGIVHAAEPKRGKLWALCPFHVDKHASWGIRITREWHGHYACWACNARGTLPMLVAHVRKCSPEEAHAWIEALNEQEPEPPQLPVDYVAPIGVEIARYEERAAFQLPREIIFKPLAFWPTPVRRYVESRHITSTQVDRWGIGFAVDGRLSGYVVLVVRDRIGLAANYHARDFADRDDVPRYRHADEWMHPDHGVLFGEEHWDRGAQSRVVVTEGAFNALAIERVTGDAVAAFGDSNVRDEHVRKLASWREVVVATDNDDAGNRAAEKLEGMLGRHTRLRRVIFPSKRDANDVEREPGGAAQLARMIG